MVLPLKTAGTVGYERTAGSPHEILPSRYGQPMMSMDSSPFLTSSATGTPILTPRIKPNVRLNDALCHLTDRLRGSFNHITVQQQHYVQAVSNRMIVAKELFD
eukprot:6206168-Amphidinium_carterae.2